MGTSDWAGTTRKTGAVLELDDDEEDGTGPGMGRGLWREVNFCSFLGGSGMEGGGGSGRLAGRGFGRTWGTQRGGCGGRSLECAKKQAGRGQG